MNPVSTQNGRESENTTESIDQRAFPNHSVDESLNRIFPKREIKRVLFIHPPDTPKNLFDFDTCRRRCYPHYPPYGLMALAGQARAAGIEPKIIDLNAIVFEGCITAENESKFDFDALVNAALDDALEGFQPDLVGVGCMFSYSHHAFQSVCEHIRIASPETPIIVGGVHVTNSMASPSTAEVFYRDLKSVDLISLYEGDTSFITLIKAVNREIPVTEVNQIIIPCQNGNHIKLDGQTTPSAQQIQKIPAYDLYPFTGFDQAAIFSI
jgi:radical SAM superfamily enzyme YgiQ (UPF0313 family)